MRTGYEGFASAQRTQGATQDSAAGPRAGGRAQSAGVPAQPADTGQLFRELRRCLKLPLPEIARRLETRIDVIQALESGDLSRLPPWPETVRIVSAYTLLAKIDPRPVLHVLAERISAGRTLPIARATTQSALVKTLRPDAGEPPSADTWAGLVSQLRAIPVPAWPVMRWGGLAAVMAVATIALTSQLPRAAANGTGFSVSNMLGGFSSLFSASERVAGQDGLRWIDVADPRARKSDKLRSPSR